MMEIWVPDRLYHALPWLCVAVGTLAWTLPMEIGVIVCASYLYGYAGLMFWWRFRDYCRYN